MHNSTKPKKIYAGIGSRKTPPGVMKDMQSIGQALARQGWTLRTGNCPGADQAFQQGANSIDANLVKLFLPWPGYQSSQVQPGNAVYTPGRQAYALAAQHHPAWSRCDRLARAMHARNVAIVVGVDLDDPVDFLVCWTPKGREVGGTAQGIRVALAYGVPVYNLALPARLGLATRLLGGECPALGRQLCFEF